jgi:hypothetical protein
MLPAVVNHRHHPSFVVPAQARKQRGANIQYPASATRYNDAAAIVAWPFQLNAWR